MLGENETNQIVELCQRPCSIGSAPRTGAKSNTAAGLSSKIATGPRLKSTENSHGSSRTGFRVYRSCRKRKCFAREIEQEPEEEQVMAAVAR